MALLLEHGVRADRRAAERFAAARGLQRLSVADYQHRTELLRMYGCALDGADVLLFLLGLKTTFLPLLAFLCKHKCATRCAG